MFATVADDDDTFPLRTMLLHSLLKNKKKEQLIVQNHKGITRVALEGLALSE